MSSAHYFVKNYSIRQVLDLMCYETQFPHTLTSTQKITRMYRCLLRRERELTMNENRGCQEDYFNNIYSESSAFFKETLETFEQQIRDTMDPTQLFNPCRPYSATSGKYFVYGDEFLAHDAFGYYSGRQVARTPAEGSHIYYPDFPHDGNVWHISPPMEYDDEVDTKDFKQQ